MAIAVLYEFPGMTREQYDRIMREAFRDRIAPGVISHASGPLEGGWWAADVYESQEVADRLGRQIVPGLRAMGVTEPPKVTVRQVHNVLTEG
jgi:hypothetical protein